MSFVRLCFHCHRQKSLRPVPVRTPSCHRVFNECGHEQASRDIADELAAKLAQLDACTNELQQLRHENVNLQVQAAASDTLKSKVNNLNQNLLSTAKELSVAEAEIRVLEVKCAASATNLKRRASREDYQRKKSAKLESQ